MKMNETKDLPPPLTYQVRALLSALTPEETYYQELNDVPNLVTLLLPLGGFLICLEGIITKLTNNKDWNLHDVVINLSIFQVFVLTGSIPSRLIEMTSYLWLYENARITTLAWDSFYTYLVAIVMVDFGFYWWHRSSHELGFMWSAHETHHTSQFYNLSTGMRVSSVYLLANWLFYVPLAMLGLPASIYLIHRQLNIIFGFWYHTSVIPKFSKVVPVLGHIIEFIFVTPSNHRVHHAVNKYCLDMNYGNTFILWDRMFGTYAEERDDEPVVFGLVHHVQTNHIVDIQYRPTRELLRKVANMNTLGNKFRVIVYGPGWSPGKPRLGDMDDVPEVRARKRYYVNFPLWATGYLVTNCSLIFYTFYLLLCRASELTLWEVAVMYSVILISCYSLGGLYDSLRYTLWLEPLRLAWILLMTLLLPMYTSYVTTVSASIVCVVSLLLWMPLKSLVLQGAAQKTKVD